MTDGSGDWIYRGRFGAGDHGAGDYGADDAHPDDDYYSGTYAGTGQAEAPDYDPEGLARGWTGEFDRPGYDQPGPAERSADPYYQPRPGDSGRYGQPSGYGAESGGPGETGGYGRSPGYGDSGGFGSSGGYGRYGQSPDDDLGGYGGGPGGPDSYLAGSSHPDAPYRHGDTFGQGGYDASGSFDRYGRDPYGDGSYGNHDSYQPDPDSTSAYEWPGQGSGDPSPAPQWHRRALTAGSADGYGDTGSFGRADSGTFGRADSGSFGRADSGSFGDTGSSGRPGTGSLRRDDVGRGQASPPARASLPPGSDGYGQWHSDPVDHAGWDDDGDHEDSGDDDWADGGAGDDGPVSRIFDRGGRDGDELDGAGRRGRSARRPRRRRGRFASVAAILAVVLVVGAGGFFGYKYVNSWITKRYGDYSGDGYGTVRVTVTPGSSLTGLGPTLLSDGVIEALRPYDTAAGAAPNAASLQPGVYKLHHDMNSKLVVAALLSAKDRVNDEIRITEGWRASQIVAALAKQTGIAASKFTQIIDHPPAALGLPKWAPAGRSAEGFLFPDTYTLLPHMSALAILQMMVQDFNQRIASLRLPVVARQKSATPYQILIAASLIQAEAGSTSDFGKISRVIWNRIQLHMKLDFDSTVFYAMGTYGTYLKTVAQENYPSKYNTYKYFGLPPGPIGSPSLAAIEAALHAPKGSELYFVTDIKRRPYKTYFTSSYSQFLQWKQEFEG